jgi:FAD/FMN-containing dehydrogenase
VRASPHHAAKSGERLMLTRREFLEQAAGIGGAAALLGGRLTPASQGLRVNDVHSKLNETVVKEIRTPVTVDALEAIVRDARAKGEPIAIAGGRHAMGGQQFATGATLVDMKGLCGVVEFDRARGEIEVQAGIQWPELYAYLQNAQRGAARPWTFVQKQTGADRLSIGGALSANVHGRQLARKPFVSDVVAFSLVDATGQLRRCSRTENADLFRAAIGGYGLFGAIATVRLRLAPRHRVRRTVELLNLEDLPRMFDRRIAEGYEYGDFQFATDLDSDALLHRGVFSCYQPVNDAAPSAAESRRQLSAQEWKELLYLAHVDRARAFHVYSSYYLTTSGQEYWSDEHQMTTYVDDYHDAIGERLGDYRHGGEMISEIYVPRAALVDFMGDVRADFRANRADLIYGTIRLIERDDETLLSWARQPWACVIFNLHVHPTPDGIARAQRDFRGLINRGLKYGGSFYLTYHRWASSAQVVAAHPRFAEFLDVKKRLDPELRFQSDWYRHYAAMFAS